MRTQKWARPGAACWRRRWAVLMKPPGQTVVGSQAGVSCGEGMRGVADPATALVSRGWSSHARRMTAGRPRG